MESTQFNADQFIAIPAIGKLKVFISSKMTELREHLQATCHDTLPKGTPLDYLTYQMRNWFETLGCLFESHNIQTEEFFEWIINDSIA